MIPALFLALTATFHPAAPTVGDPIAIDFPSAVKLDVSKDFEIVSQRNGHVVIRTFEPKPIVLSGVAGATRFTNLIGPVHSVLRKNDDMKPAPLAPPRPSPYPRYSFIAIGIAALAAIIAWAAAILVARKRTSGDITPAIAPADRFRSRVLALRKSSAQQRWAALADATREYLAATRPLLGSDLTTTELLQRLSDEQNVVAAILRQGDLEKFSPWGAEARSFDEIASRALELIPADVEQERDAA